jgi:hypothetical protein
MAAGDHIRISRVAYAHHAIDCGDGTVIHYTGEVGAKLLGFAKPSVRRDTIDQIFPDGTRQLVRTSSDPAVTLLRAESKLGESKYNVLWRNCEHFAHWCQTGVPFSKQVAAMFAGAPVGAAALLFADEVLLLWLGPELIVGGVGALGAMAIAPALLLAVGAVAARVIEASQEEGISDAITIEEYRSILTRAVLRALWEGYTDGAEAVLSLVDATAARVGAAPEQVAKALEFGARAGRAATEIPGLLHRIAAPNSKSDVGEAYRFANWASERGSSVGRGAMNAASLVVGQAVWGLATLLAGSDEKSSPPGMRMLRESGVPE